jgi:SPP1 family predicted phage head-tail adaptor
MKPLKDKRIRIYKTTYTQDAIGNQLPEYELVAGGPVWAYFRQIGGSEYYAAAAAQIPGEEVLFQVNWRPDYDTTMIVVYRDKVYNISRIDAFEGYKADIRLYCKLDPQAEPPDALKVWDDTKLWDDSAVWLE